MNDLTPGRNLDLIVAEKVMDFEIVEFKEPWEKIDPHSHPYLGGVKWTVQPGKFIHTRQHRAVGFTVKTEEPKVDVYSDPFPYSTDISAAWKVADKMREKHGWFDIAWYPKCESSIHGPPYEAHWSVSTSGLSYKVNPVKSDVSAPHAICLAALKAAGAIE